MKYLSNPAALGLQYVEQWVRACKYIDKNDTNDDGYDAENIQNLFLELQKIHDVWIVAPKNNCSGMSAAISFLKDTEIEKVSENVFSVDGTPADCTYFGGRVPWQG